MPEGPSNVEIAHHIHERAHEHAQGQHEILVEILEVLLLAVVAVATAWSGYQSALWDGQSAKLYGASSRIRIDATQNQTRGGQEQVYDGTTFNFWLQATLTGNEKLAADYEKRFRPEYRPAFRAWLALDPLNNPRAPPWPIYMPQYTNALNDRGAEQNAHASAVFDRAAGARETGDKYVRTTVLLATVLFLIAISQRFGLFKVRIALILVALVLLGLALSSIATYPRL
jgi:hypothetical protein